jgi:aminoglycoside 3-N-acetyltransferase
MLSKESPLFESLDCKIYCSDFVKALRNLKIEQGDIIFVHSDISNFGKLATNDRTYLLESIILALKEIVGKEGTIIMPTFTYSFDKEEPFDILNSKSSVGTLTEFFRKQKNVIRTNHPSHSAAIFGNDKEFFLDIGKDTFGDDSIFGKVLSKQGKFVFLGTPLSKSCTFIHSIEQKHGVPYRYLRNYSCKFREGEKIYESTITFYYKFSYFFTDMLNLEQNLIANKLLDKVKLGDGEVSCINSEILMKKGLSLLDKDIYFFLKNKGLFKLFNLIAYPLIRYAQGIAKLLDKISIKLFRKGVL